MQIAARWPAELVVKIAERIVHALYALHKNMVL